MDVVPLAIACVPLAFYMFWLGLVNLRRRPLVVAGATDIAALAVAVCGLLIIGPMNLFLPQGAAARFGPLAWPMLLGLYGLCVLLYLLVARPRLVVFNIALPELRAVLEPLIQRLDSAAKIAGDAVHMPQMEVQFHLDSAFGMRNVSLVATGDRQSHTGWQRLQRELTAALRGAEVSPNPRGFTFAAAGLLLFFWPIVQLLQTPPQLVAQQLRDMLRM